MSLDCMGTSPSSLLPRPTSIRPSSINPYNRSLDTGHISTSCNSLGCSGNLSPLSPLYLTMSALRKTSKMNHFGVDTFSICKRISSYIGTILLKRMSSYIDQTLHFMLKSYTLFNGVPRDATMVGTCSVRIVPSRK